MSERQHNRVSKHYASPLNNSALKKPAMRMSPRKITSPQMYRIPPKRLDSPEILKRYQQRVQDRTEIPSYLQNIEYNTVTNPEMSYTSPLKPRSQDKDISLKYPQLIPDTKGVRSPRREIPFDTSPIRGRNIISKLKQEMSMIEALDKSPRVKKERETKKSVRFDIPSEGQGEGNNVVIKDEMPKLESSRYPVANDEMSNIKSMLDSIIKKQQSQDLLLKEILTRQEKLEEQLLKK
ncbi:hypothetical protein MOSE0_H07404 [Monosporozyma servazzii]